MFLGKRLSALTAGPCRALAAAAALALAAGCYSGDKKDLITIGGVFSMTGEGHRPGLDGANGASLAAAEANGNGGVSGRRLDLVVHNDAGDPARALRLYSSLVEKGAVAVLGSGAGALASALGVVAEPDAALLVVPAPPGAADSRPYVHIQRPAPLDGKNPDLERVVRDHLDKLFRPPPPGSISSYLCTRRLMEAIGGAGGAGRGAVFSAVEGMGQGDRAARAGGGGG